MKILVSSFRSSSMLPSSRSRSAKPSARGPPGSA
jgi:hypothetical protein